MGPIRGALRDILLLLLLLLQQLLLFEKQRVRHVSVRTLSKKKNCVQTGT